MTETPAGRTDRATGHRASTAHAQCTGRCRRDTPGGRAEHPGAPDPAYREPSSTCSARSPTGSCRRSSGSPRTPAGAHADATRSRWRRWPPPSSATSAAARPARRARRRPDAAMDAVRDGRSTPSTRAPRPRTGSKAWSRRTSGTASRPTSTARSRSSSTRGTRDLVLDALAGHRARATSRPPGAGGRSRRTRGVGGRLALWARRLMGEALRRRSGWPPSGTRCRAAVGGVDRPGLTSRRSAGCSPGSPSTTPSGWRAWAGLLITAGSTRRRCRATGPHRGEVTSRTA